jgi:hypothetical protein
MARRKISDKEILAQIPNARLRAAAAHAKGLRAISARYDANSGRVLMETSTGYLFGFPATDVPALKNALPSDLRTVELSPSGSGLHWETLDIDLDVPALIVSVLEQRDKFRELARSAGSVTSERKAAAARANGAKGGRPRTRGFEKAASKRVINVQSDQTGEFKIAAAKEHVVRGRKHDAAVHPSKSVAINKSGKRAGAGVRLRKK